MGIYDEVYQSPNFGYPKGSGGRQGQDIIGAGVHITGAHWQSNYNWIMNPVANASYNSIIKDDGTIVSLVPEQNAAYSHGRINKPSWPLLKSGVNPNLYTLSVARTGSNQNNWTSAQMDATVKILKYWSDKYDFPLERPYIFGHFEIDSVGRWYCPGRPFFDALVKELEATKKIIVPLPMIQRRIGVEVNGNMTNQVGYLINNRTYVRAAYITSLVGVETTGHGDHIKINTGGD